MDETETREVILKVVKKRKKQLSKRQIAEKVGLSPATVSKYVEIMVAEGILKIKREGIRDLVRLSVDV